jgi:hypothetical protein
MASRRLIVSGLKHPIVYQGGHFLVPDGADPHLRSIEVELNSLLEPPFPTPVGRGRNAGGKIRGTSWRCTWDLVCEIGFH